jgi:hypothetical protein
MNGCSKVQGIILGCKSLAYIGFMFNFRDAGKNQTIVTRERFCIQW